MSQSIAADGRVSARFGRMSGLRVFYSPLAGKRRARRPARLTATPVAVPRTIVSSHEIPWTQWRR
jgi:hypothetical protein